MPGPDEEPFELDRTGAVRAREVDRGVVDEERRRCIGRRRCVADVACKRGAIADLNGSDGGGGVNQGGKVCPDVLILLNVGH